MLFETASAGSGANGIAEALVATKLANSSVVAHASISFSFDMCVFSLKQAPLLTKLVSLSGAFQAIS